MHGGDLYSLFHFPFFSVPAHTFVYMHMHICIHALVFLGLAEQFNVPFLSPSLSCEIVNNANN